MADFLGLSNDIGGTVSGAAGSPQADTFGSKMTDISGGAGTETGVASSGAPTGVTGITWNDIIKAALQYGSKPGSGDEAFASLIPSSNNKQNASTLKPLTSDDDKKSDQGSSEAMKWLAGALGIGG